MAETNREKWKAKQRDVEGTKAAIKARREKERQNREALDKHDMRELDTDDWKCKRWCNNCRRSEKTIQTGVRPQREHECEKYGNPYESGGEEVQERRSHHRKDPTAGPIETRIPTHYKGKRVRPSYETWERLEELEGKEMTGEISKTIRNE